MLRINASNGLVIAVWTDAPTLAEVGEMDRAGQKQARLNKGKVALLNVVVSGSPRFDEQVRARVKEMTSQGRPFNWAVAHLILVGGLAGAGIRAFLTTGLLFARSEIPKRVFGDRAECAAWLARTLRGAWTPARVESMLDDTLESPAVAV